MDKLKDCKSKKFSQKCDEDKFQSSQNNVTDSLKIHKIIYRTNSRNEEYNILTYTINKSPTNELINFYCIPNERDILYFGNLNEKWTYLEINNFFGDYFNYYLNVIKGSNKIEQILEIRNAFYNFSKCSVCQNNTKNSTELNNDIKVCSKSICKKSFANCTHCHCLLRRAKALGKPIVLPSSIYNLLRSPPGLIPDPPKIPPPEYPCIELSMKEIYSDNLKTVEQLIPSFSSSEYPSSQTEQIKHSLEKKNSSLRSSKLPPNLPPPPTDMPPLPPDSPKITFELTEQIVELKDSDTVNKHVSLAASEIMPPELAIDELLNIDLVNIKPLNYIKCPGCSGTGNHAQLCRHGILRCNLGKRCKFCHRFDVYQSILKTNQEHTNLKVNPPPGLLDDVSLNHFNKDISEKLDSNESTIESIDPPPGLELKCLSTIESEEILLEQEVKYVNILDIRQINLSKCPGCTGTGNHAELCRHDSKCNQKKNCKFCHRNSIVKIDINDKKFII